ncbi:MAG TPA: DUF362 domain-containing protein [Bacteroidales bacterium]|jgi:uncharacterized protein (DUF362 family)/Pyruvate/2-oxoacid:ferredoxin oxidoreductase delta subunit|nr:DUF362 domain-containing protein [Bacteroidales bacterium]HQH23879.1 DUF362 domain-containing protein [Bacteroidales bacterium]HQJ81209.1 DUF362 domain-containing protein [Bacteroidales bacterium]
MNSIVAIRKCNEYNVTEITDLIADIYESCNGPDPRNKKILLKPNILSDSDPLKCVSTHPAVVEAMIIYLQSKGATVLVGDSPSIHMRGFRPVNSGITAVCEKTGAEWVDFLLSPSAVKAGGSRIRIASAVRETDLIISLPKFKNHELMLFTGAIKNTLGLVPGFIKARQHAIHQDRDRFAEFLVDLNESVLPHFFLMDAVRGMEGPGPGQGIPVSIGVLIGSANPLALDIIATTLADYDPLEIPTNTVALARGKWLRDPGEIIYDGPEPESLVKKDFKRIIESGSKNTLYSFIFNRFKRIRRIQRRPVFIHRNCTGCMECIRICPVNAIRMHPEKKNHVVLNDRQCIRCFCCSEVCRYHAVEIRRKLFGV